MKAFTDIEQSKKLAKILPLESADMHWQYVEEDNGQLQWFSFPKDFSINQHDSFPCWSLAALLDILDYPQLRTLGGEKIRWMTSVYPSNDCRYDSCWHDNPVDACYELILRLHNINLIK